MILRILGRTLALYTTGVLGSASLMVVTGASLERALVVSIFMGLLFLPLFVFMAYLAEKYLKK